MGSFYRDDDPNLRALVGKQVTSVDVSHDQHAIRFNVVNHPAIVWDTRGDCCSESWWADAIGLKQIRDAVVTNVVILDNITENGYSVDDGRTRQEYDQAYGFGVKTTRGCATFIFRNSSNGYYGGDACLVEDNPERYKWVEMLGSEWSA